MTFQGARTPKNDFTALETLLSQIIQPQDYIIAEPLDSVHIGQYYCTKKNLLYYYSKRRPEMFSSSLNWDRPLELGYILNTLRNSELKPSLKKKC